MMGAVESLNALGLAVGLPVGGALATLGSTRVAFLLVGVGAATTSVAFFRIRAGEAAPQETAPAGSSEEADGESAAAALVESGPSKTAAN